MNSNNDHSSCQPSVLKPQTCSEDQSARAVARQEDRGYLPVRHGTDDADVHDNNRHTTSHPQSYQDLCTTSGKQP